jgi:hypothetical protein
MGRTVPSFRMLLEEMIAELSVFRRALHGEDKDAFDNLMNKAKNHASSCTVALRGAKANVSAGHQVQP